MSKIPRKANYSLLNTKVLFDPLCNLHLHLFNIKHSNIIDSRRGCLNVKESQPRQSVLCALPTLCFLHSIALLLVMLSNSSLKAKGLVKVHEVIILLSAAEKKKKQFDN